MNNDLVWVVQSEEEVDYYLENVTTKQFIEDVKSLVHKSNNTQQNKVYEFRKSLIKLEILVLLAILAACFLYIFSGQLQQLLIK